MIDIKTNSRKVMPGDIFVALRGIRTDGHDYIPDAIKRGAKKIIAEEGKYEVSTEVVNDTRVYLNNYLKEHYNERFKQIKIVGITGTNGKTTICNLLSAALNKLGVKSASIGTLGFYIGDELIESLENSTPDICDIYEYIDTAIDEGCKVVVMEVSSHALMNGRVETLSFDTAIFTNLTQDHLDYHVTMENYAAAKQRLFQKLNPDGMAFVNADDAYYENFLLYNNKNYTYGYNEMSDFKIISEDLKENGTVFKFEYKKNTYQVNTRLVGKYNIYNIMPVIMYLLLMGEDPVLILKTIYSLKPPKGRFEVIPYKNNKIIVDYAHTPDGVLKVVEAASLFTKGKIYAVFGCTGERDRSKRPIMARIVSENTERFIITEDDLYYEDFEQIKNDMLLGIKKDNYEVCMDRKKAIELGISYLMDEDTLLVLGKGHEEILKIREKRIPFNDKEVVLSILENL